MCIRDRFRVHFNDKRVNSHFLVSYLLSPIGQKYLLETKGHTGVPALAQPTTNFRRLWIPLPEIAEQVAIAEALSNVDSLISSLQKLIEKKKAIKQGAMQEPVSYTHLATMRSSAESSSLLISTVSVF